MINKTTHKDIEKIVKKLDKIHKELTEINQKLSHLILIHQDENYTYLKSSIPELYGRYIKEK